MAVDCSTLDGCRCSAFSLANGITRGEKVYRENLLLANGSEILFSVTIIRDPPAKLTIFKCILLCNSIQFHSSAT